MPLCSLQRWEGYVLEVYGESFTARLVDLTEDQPDEEAEIYLRKIAPEQRLLVTPGAVFSWEIIDADGEVESTIRFSEEVWTEEDLEATRKKTEKYLTFLEEEP